MQAELVPDVPYVLALRKLSSAGVEERNTHILTYAQIDTEGSLLPSPLAAPHDVTVDLQPNETILFGFSHHVPLGFASPTVFEVFSDGGSGTLDFENPIAAISNVKEEQADFEVTVTPAALPAKFAVRGRKDDQDGPLSRIVEVKLAPAPIAPLVL